MKKTSSLFLVFVIFFSMGCSSKFVKVNDIGELNIASLGSPIPTKVSGFSFDSSSDAKALNSELVMLIKSKLPEGYVTTENQDEAQVRVSVFTLYFGENRKKASKRVLSSDADSPYAKGYFGSAQILVGTSDDLLFVTDTFSEAPLSDGKKSAIQLNATKMADSVSALLVHAIGQEKVADSRQ